MADRKKSSLQDSATDVSFEIFNFQNLHFLTGFRLNSLHQTFAGGTKNKHLFNYIFSEFVLFSSTVTTASCDELQAKDNFSNLHSKDNNTSDLSREDSFEVNA